MNYEGRYSSKNGWDWFSYILKSYDVSFESISNDVIKITLYSSFKDKNKENITIKHSGFIFKDNIGDFDVVKNNIMIIRRELKDMKRKLKGTD